MLGERLAPPRIRRRSDAFELRGEGDRLLLVPSAEEVRRSRLQAIALGTAALAVSIGATWLTPWAWAAAAASALALLVLPGRATAAPLLRIHPGEGTLISLQPEFAGPVVPFSAVESVAGAYETQGWDARSVITLGTRDGLQRPILAIAGADERKPEELCRLLGELLGCPASYTGAEGKSKAFPPGSGPNPTSARR